MVVLLHQESASDEPRSLAGGARRPCETADGLLDHQRSRAGPGFCDRVLVAPRADAFVAVSRANQEKMLRLGLPAPKIHHIPNGIAWSGGPADGAGLRAEFAIPPEAPVVGVVAVMRPEKRLDVLVEAMAILRQVQPDVRLLIVGGSSLNGHLADLKQLVERRSLLDCVHFLGIRTDVPSVLDALDVACLSSDREGMPIALMEYMAAGKPIVSTFVGSLRIETWQ